MASGAGKVNLLRVAVPLFTPLAVGSAGFAAWRTDWKALIASFVTGPGRNSRIALLFFAVLNWKNLPFAWTWRVLYTILYHYAIREAPALGPKALFKPILTQSRVSLLEIDYNLHKSNSTYFADLDVSRSHAVTYLIRPSLRKIANNEKTRIVVDPSGEALKGGLNIALGSVEMSFKREMPAFKGFEIWTRVIAWDRKWFYLVSHFLPKGTAKPTSWLDPGFANSRTRRVGDASEGWEKKIYASAISKYVFKVGRFTVHPAIVMGASDLLPERPGGWTSGENQLGDESVDVSDVDLSVEGEWDWRRIEAKRREGLKLSMNFHSLDELAGFFDGGKHGAIGRFSPG